MRDEDMEYAIKLSQSYYNCRNITPGDYCCKILNVELLSGNRGGVLRFVLEYFDNSKDTKIIFSDYPLCGKGKYFCVYSLLPIFTLNQIEIDYRNIDRISDFDLLTRAKALIGIDTYFSATVKCNFYRNGYFKEEPFIDIRLQHQLHITYNK